MNDDSVCALVGAVGGAGTTRLALEFGASLARDGRSVAIVDAAYATQGLSTAVPGRLDVDLTAVLLDDRPLAAARYDLGLDLPGRVAVAPARAPFERLSRAKTSQCAQRLAERIGVAADEFDRVLLDVPPVAANPAVAAAAAADRVVVVAPDTRRGVDAVSRTRDRLADVDAPADAVVANRVGEDRLGEDRRIEQAAAAVPRGDARSLLDAPVAVEPTEFATAVGAAAETALAVDLDLDEPESSSLSDYF